MAVYTDPEARCTCGHFVGDHIWDDPLLYKPGETFDQRAVRVKDFFKTATASDHETRNKASMNRKLCHADGACVNGCKEYVDSTLSAREQAAITAQADTAAAKAEAARFQTAVEQAVAQAMAKYNTAVPATPVASVHPVDPAKPGA